ncbi:asparagine--tRNA ligase [Tenacibaculum finnmarkense genomovar finnmarkense]|uniref:Asparagine--tRNA ligase n=1 Tax=Tenacibaculum finnmarkense genomovar finnmarkense TaxID=1458503 RepID=A0AAP1RGC5_9FLAO|nr:asparagine--tRNA ligase [Tenacibaculum finnmarkense]MBE7653127.1 asparagine--tRNA ligase [Tenacibaculum finnmarkense genomovar finnmarkense]MBE7692933.1 asparagine--tRNA ligase [Tenacibaculum finnmarkense genomovar finnmarkense]MBE7695503.1 asparagine--tRNA ligase [Tenacibaculum finnmarkense genomovar finnmarkense]MCD8411644.1 asparagine--tRNA ligase [Tenacibaculum finnmarkense genomovar ulcerans]MCD8416534.1 asparagine--tRNA ligase [Tenacibaculum finnmarkense genomovar finnmarkense]
MKRSSVNELLHSDKFLQEVHVKGWVRTFRSNRFIALNDGSTINNIQCVVDFENTDEELLKRITTSAAVSITGTLIESQGKGQSVEIKVTKLEILGDSNPDEYPIQPKKHSLEFLRENAHLRIRTNTFSAIMRVRSALSFGVHKYFQENGFNYVNTPIVTGSDAEGAGEMFHVSNFETNKAPLNEEGEIDYTQDFFGKETNLTVSGQLEAETYAMALGKVYTFGPTFRAENSNTTRHLAEFWMIEPEVAFNDLDANMDLSEDFIKSVLNYVLENCKDDLAFLDNRLTQEDKTKPQAERSEMGLIEKLNFVANNNFKRVSYTEAFEILRNCKPNKKKKFQFPITEWGVDLQSEHERYLVEKHFKCPVILFDYPATIKAFYMRLNDDGKTVRAMDVLFPGIGEMVGGSQREERLDVLKAKMADLNIDEEELWWYLDTRKFGTAVHSGFGLGFERLVLFATGMSNIRDVIPFPRTPQNADF